MASVFDLVHSWPEEFAAAYAGDLGPLVDAFRSHKQITPQVQEALADFLDSIKSFKRKRPAHRPKTIGAAARLLMGDRSEKEAAANMVDLIMLVWRGDSKAREKLYERDKTFDLGLYVEVMKTPPEQQRLPTAIKLTAEWARMPATALQRYRRRSRNDRRRR